MTKLETFIWRMWHVYLLIFITILLTGTFVRYGYRLQAAYSLDDRLYDYTNKKVTVTSFQNVKIGNFNVLGVKFGNEKALERSQLVVGRTYLAFKESRYKASKHKKDPKNYDIIHYYQLGKDTGKGYTINVLDLAKKLGVENRVKFIGGVTRSRLSDYLESSDLYVMPTWAEGLPRVIIEAMAKGLPCITTPVSGNPELVSEHFLVGYSDINTLADRIEELVKNKSIYEVTSKENFERSLQYEASVLEKRRDAYYTKLKSCVK